METSSSEHVETGNSAEPTDLRKVQTYLRTMEDNSKESREYGDAQTGLNVVLNRVQLAEGLHAVSALVNEALTLNRFEGR